MKTFSELEESKKKMSKMIDFIIAFPHLDVMDFDPNDLIIPLRFVSFLSRSTLPFTDF